MDAPTPEIKLKLPWYLIHNTLIADIGVREKPSEQPQWLVLEVMMTRAGYAFAAAVVTLAVDLAEKPVPLAETPRAAHWQRMARVSELTLTMLYKQAAREGKRSHDFIMNVSAECCDRLDSLFHPQGAQLPEKLDDNDFANMGKLIASWRKDVS